MSNIVAAAFNIMAKRTKDIPPVASLANTTVTTAQTGISFKADASASYDPDGTIVSYKFNWGDGTSTTSTRVPTATHTYTAVGNFTLILTVTDNSHSTAQASKIISVSTAPPPPPVLTGVTVSGPTTGTVGQLLGFTATGVYNPPPNVDVTSSATWTSDTPAVASIIGAGQVQCNAAGTATISATFGGFSGSQLLTVSNPLPNPPTTPANPNPANGATGISTTPTLQWTSTGAATYNVSFGTSSPPPNVATGITASSFTPAGPLANSTNYFWSIVAVNAGGSTQGPVWTFQTLPAVQPPILQSITVAGPTSGTKGQTLSYTATAHYNAPNPDQDVTAAAAWSSDNTTAATILSAGQVSCVAAGTANIKATYQGFSSSVALTVVEPPPNPPGTPASPTPANGATSVATNPTLLWTSTGATTYAVAFGIANPPPSVATGLTTSSYVPGLLNHGTVYFWRITATNAGGSTVGPIWSFTTTPVTPPPPAVPSQPSPADGVGGLGTAVTLGWFAQTDATSWDVYFGTSSAPPLVQAGVTTNSFNPGVTVAGTQYFWKIVANNLGGSTSGPVWSFSTLAVPSGFAPANGATGVSLTPTLTWNNVAGATAYFVNFGTSPNPTTVATVYGASFVPGGLAGSTQYFWQIIAVNSGVTQTTGPVISFTTAGGTVNPPNAPINPVPSSGATGIATNQQLSWTDGGGATSFTVFFGTANPPPQVQTGLVSPTYNPGTLANSTTYFWKIRSVNSAGSTDGAVWSFQTAAAATLPGTPSNPFPAAGATGVTTTPTLSWSATNATSYDVYFGTANPPPNVVLGQAAASYSPGVLSTATTYNWKIVANNSTGSTAGPVWSFTTQTTAPPSGVVGAGNFHLRGCFLLPGAPSYPPYGGFFGFFPSQGYMSVRRIGGIPYIITSGRDSNYQDASGNYRTADPLVMIQPPATLAPNNATAFANNVRGSIFQIWQDTFGPVTNGDFQPTCQYTNRNAPAYNPFYMKGLEWDESLQGVWLAYQDVYAANDDPCLSFTHLNADGTTVSYGPWRPSVANGGGITRFISGYLELLPTAFSSRADLVGTIAGGKRLVMGQTFLSQGGNAATGAQAHIAQSLPIPGTTPPDVVGTTTHAITTQPILFYNPFSGLANIQPSPAIFSTTTRWMCGASRDLPPGTTCGPTQPHGDPAPGLLGPTDVNGGVSLWQDYLTDVVWINSPTAQGVIYGCTFAFDPGQVVHTWYGNNECFHCVTSPWFQGTGPATSMKRMGLLIYDQNDFAKIAKGQLTQATIRETAYIPLASVNEFDENPITTGDGAVGAIRLAFDAVASQLYLAIVNGAPDGETIIYVYDIS